MWMWISSGLCMWEDQAIRNDFRHQLSWRWGQYSFSTSALRFCIILCTVIFTILHAYTLQAFWHLSSLLQTPPAYYRYSMCTFMIYIITCVWACACIWMPQSQYIPYCPLLSPPKKNNCTAFFAATSISAIASLKEVPWPGRIKRRAVGRNFRCASPAK
jgi:hypothetical protein